MWKIVEYESIFVTSNTYFGGRTINVEGGETRCRTDKFFYGYIILQKKYTGKENYLVFHIYLKEFTSLLNKIRIILSS